MQNVEFKAELRDPVAARRQCGVLGAAAEGTFLQTDTYFKLTDGRVKRREIDGQPAQWIFYHRPDRVSPRLSVFTILSDAQARRRWGTVSLREWLVVKKSRELWMLKKTRIHLDLVDELGSFIEFEVPVTRKNDVKLCHQTVAHLREAFGPVLGEPVAVSYSDLMAQLLAERKLES